MIGNQLALCPRVRSQQLRRHCAAFLLCGLLLATTAWAQSPRQGAQNLNHNAADTQFLQSAGDLTLAAIRFSSAVNDRVADVAIKAYAESVRAENRQIRERLLHLASANGLTLSTHLSPRDKAIQSRLSHAPVAGLSGRYASLMVRQEQAAVTRFRQEATHGSQPLIRDFARRKLPELEGLLAQAHRIADQAASEPGTEPGLKPQARD